VAGGIAIGLAMVVTTIFGGLGQVAVIVAGGVPAVGVWLYMAVRHPRGSLAWRLGLAVLAVLAPRFTIPLALVIAEVLKGRADD
jgi:hypothetical protein